MSVSSTVRRSRRFKKDWLKKEPNQYRSRRIVRPLISCISTCLCIVSLYYSKADHIPAVAPYRLSEVLSDLLELANNTLTVGGRLVYWLPVSRAE